MVINPGKTWCRRRMSDYSKFWWMTNTTTGFRAGVSNRSLIGVFRMKNDLEMLKTVKLLMASSRNLIVDRFRPRWDKLIGLFPIAWESHQYVSHRHRGIILEEQYETNSWRVWFRCIERIPRSGVELHAKIDADINRHTMTGVFKTPGQLNIHESTSDTVIDLA
jgi:hypothetical protein